MARIDSLRLLLAAEIPADLETVEALLREIVARIDTLEPGSDAHTLAHRRMNDLLTARDRLRPSLVDFLLARIAEDEVKVDYMTHEAERVATAPIFGHHPPGWLTGVDIFVSPTRWRAECEAKRRIVERLMNHDDAGICQGTAVALLRTVAQPYAGHPDFREEWRP